jgi:hypothetical protein
MCCTGFPANYEQGKIQDNHNGSELLNAAEFRFFRFCDYPSLVLSSERYGVPRTVVFYTPHEMFFQMCHLEVRTGDEHFA